MGLHPSLKVDSAVAQQRSVMSRIERIKDMMRKGLWKDGQPVTGLPKTKITRIKARKAVKEAAPADGAAPKAEGAAPAVAGKAAPAADAKAPKAK